jgi:hypothetical protein
MFCFIQPYGSFLPLIISNFYPNFGTRVKLFALYFRYLSPLHLKSSNPYDIYIFLDYPVIGLNFWHPLQSLYVTFCFDDKDLPAEKVYWLLVLNKFLFG